MARVKDEEYELKIRTKFGDALAKLLGEKTWDDITIKDICKEAGVSIGTFYYYYTSKEHLLYEKLDKLDHYFDTALTKEASELKLYDALELYWQSYIHWIKRKGFQRRAQILKFYLCDIPDGEWFYKRGLYTTLLEIFNRAIENKEVKMNLTAEEMAKDVDAILLGQLSIWCISKGDYPLSKSVARCIHMYYNEVTGVPDILVR